MQLDLKGIDGPPTWPQGAELRDGQPLKPGNYVTADNKISMRRETGADALARLRGGSLRNDRLATTRD
jgi:hypothetical protein